jgi:mannosylfructose-phosphate synthase
LAIGADAPRDRKRLESWRKLADELVVARHIKWRGYVEDEHMADYYRAGGVFALPSRYEPFGMTAIEAMACGTPSVITVHGGLHDLIDFGVQALFADPKRPEEFGAVLSLPLRYPRVHEKLTVEGARFARRMFGWTGVAKRTLTVFDQLKGRYTDWGEDEAN